MSEQRTAINHKGDEAVIGRPCGNCHGHGDLIGQGGATGRSTCWTCGGTGKVNPPPRPIVGPMHNHRTMRPAARGKCPACDAKRESNARAEQNARTAVRNVPPGQSGRRGTREDR